MSFRDNGVTTWRSGVAVLCLASSFLFGPSINAHAQSAPPAGRGAAASRVSVASIAMPEKRGRKPGNLHTLEATARTLKPARPASGPNLGASLRPVSARSCAVSGAERPLEEKKIELIAIQVAEGLAAKFGELSSQRTATWAEPARAADSLKREIAQYRKEVKDLSDRIKALSDYTKEIENSLSDIDASLSTPSVLRKKLEQQQNGLKP